MTEHAFPVVANAGAAGEVTAVGRLDVDLGQVADRVAQAQTLRRHVDQKLGAGRQAEPCRFIRRHDQPATGINNGAASRLASVGPTPFAAFDHPVEFGRTQFVKMCHVAAMTPRKMKKGTRTSKKATVLVPKGATMPTSALLSGAAGDGCFPVPPSTRCAP